MDFKEVCLTLGALLILLLTCLDISPIRRTARKSPVPTVAASVSLDSVLRAPLKKGRTVE